MSDLRKACEAWLGSHIKTVDMLPEDVDALESFAKQQRAEVWREAAKALSTFDVPAPSSFTAIAFNDACRDLSEHCEQQAKEMGL